MAGSVAACTALAVRFAVSSKQVSVEDCRADAENLYPFAGTCSKANYMDKDEMWRALGGMRGAYRIACGAIAINRMAGSIAHRDPDTRDAARIVTAIMVDLTLMLMFGLPIEAAVCWLFPKFPRAIAGAYLRLYCDMHSVMDAAEHMATLA